jgi:integrative and conjugative element protein (TIGR02256 family)
MEHMSRYRQTACWKREAGGQLFARVNGDEWLVKEATGPRRVDIRSRFGFLPNRRAEQREIDEHFSLGLHYVGDWHTHPEPMPKPSATDLSSMQEMVAASGHELVGFLMLIIGTEQGSNGVWTSVHYANGRWQQLTSTAAAV